MQDLINKTAKIIVQYNPTLAVAFRTTTCDTRRVDYAHAFAAGFANGNPEADVHPAAALVLRAAYHVRDVRAAQRRAAA